MKFLQTKPQIKNMIVKYYNLYYAANKNRDVKEIVNDNENDYFNSIDTITPNRNISIKP